MKTAIILGSVRTERQGHKAAYFIQKCLNDFGIETIMVDCKLYNLPMLDSGQNALSKSLIGYMRAMKTGMEGGTPN